MGPYTTIYEAGNQSGYCYFDADALTEIEKGDVVVEKVADKLGEGETVRLVIDGKETAKEVVLHFNGKTNDRQKNTLVMSIKELALLPAAVQEELYQHEQLPAGRREGVTKPPREKEAAVVK